MKTWACAIWLIAALASAGCGPIEVQPDAGRYFPIYHTGARFDEAVAAAEKHCGGKGKAHHLGTEYFGPAAGTFRQRSRFECTPL